MLCRAVIALFVFLSQAQLVQLSIAPPPRASKSTAETGLVLLEGEIEASGRMNGLRVNQGTAPFIEPSLEAVRRWSFDCRANGDNVPATVVFLFRAKTDLPNSSFQIPLPLNSDSERAPQPVVITDPGYPIDSAAEGTVIIQMNVDEQGRVQGTSIVVAVPSLTDAAVRAVSRWCFQPAQHHGKPVSGVAIAVISFLRPAMVY